MRAAGRDTKCLTKCVDHCEPQSGPSIITSGRWCYQQLLVIPVLTTTINQYHWPLLVSNHHDEYKPLSFTIMNGYSLAESSCWPSSALHRFRCLPLDECEVMVAVQNVILQVGRDWYHGRTTLGPQPPQQLGGYHSRVKFMMIHVFFAGFLWISIRPDLKSNSCYDFSWLWAGRSTIAVMTVLQNMTKGFEHHRFVH